MMSTHLAIVSRVTEGDGPHGPYLRWLFRFITGGFCSKITGMDPAKGDLAMILGQFKTTHPKMLIGKTVFITHIPGRGGFRDVVGITRNLQEAKEA